MDANILVVDDEPSVRRLLSDWLQREGYRCVTAGEAGEAMDVVSREPADVVLLDLALPGEDGVALARRIRESDGDVALIMVTGMQRFDAAVEGMRLGVLDYLLKPLTQQQLLESVDRAVRWRDANRRLAQERRRLEQAIERRSVELAGAFAEIDVASTSALEALLVALNTRNPDAFEHARRVAGMAAALADAMGIDEPERTQVQRGALLHDIGKVAMPDALIHKPGPLTDEEIAIIRTHPQIGHDIVAVVPALRAAAEIILASHEAWDGSGYPRGLTGVQIPAGARITAVVDTYDALTWARAYRDPVTTVRAAAELVRCAGSQFDPDVVQAWLRLIDRVEAGPVQ
ncbi:MAG TPA: HD domain-containing phosphohydrolase [Vicinamibacterales bacterium]|nr:HD domain-containing phosphohydrolase [Vicinamibacterales bacterium]